MQIIEELESQLARPSRMYQGYLFDLDGTIYLGKELLPGALDLVAALRDRGSKVVFLTNNPTRDPQMYLDKLNGLGIPTAPDEMLNTVMTMRTWLLEHAADKKIFVIGERPLISALEAAGLSLSEDPREIDVVVASYDRTFEYRKLQIAFDAIAVYKRAMLVTTNPDVFCPFPGGHGEPDAGAIVAAIEACTGVEVPGERRQAGQADGGDRDAADRGQPERLPHGGRPALHRHRHGHRRRDEHRAGADRRDRPVHAGRVRAPPDLGRSAHRSTTARVSLTRWLSRGGERTWEPPWTSTPT